MPKHSEPAGETVSEQQRAFRSGGDAAPRVSAAACRLQVFRWKARHSLFSRANRGVRVLDGGCCL